MRDLWKQSGMASMACTDLGHLKPLALARRAKLFLYGFALAFAACTAYLAISSSAGAAGEGSTPAAWFGGVFASTAPYRSQISNFFSSIFPTNSSSPSPEFRANGSAEKRGGSSSSHGGSGGGGRDGSVGGGVPSNRSIGNGGVVSESSGEKGGVGANKPVGSGVPSSNLIGNGSVAAARSGGKNNAGSGSGVPSTNLAGNGSAAAKSGAKDGIGPNNQEGSGSTGNRGAAMSGAKDGIRSNNKQEGSGLPSNSSAADVSAAAKSSAKGASEPNKQAGTGVLSSNLAGNGSAAKSGVADGVGSNNQSGRGGDDSAGNDVSPKSGAKDGGVSNNQAGSGSGVPSNSSAGNGSAAKANAKNAVGSNNQAGSGSGSNNSRRNASPTKSSGKDGIEPNKDGSQAGKNQKVSGSGSQGNVAPISNHNVSAIATTKKDGAIGSQGSGTPSKDLAVVVSPVAKNQNQTGNGVASSGPGGAVSKQKEATPSPQGNAGPAKDHSSQAVASKPGNYTALLIKGNRPASDVGGNKKDDWIKAMASCDMFQGKWVQDDSYPLYPEGSCPHIDEPFDCYLNGRPDRAYQKLRWQPDGCSIPRLNPTDMLESLRGKRLVFVGDSLNRNMWESLVCILRNSIKDKKKVFEASGRHEFKTEGSYSFLFTDYNCSVEFFRSPFLVQEWEMPASNGKTKETLRLDIIESSSPKYKDADIIIFNTGHWWTHEKTALGKDYYQEGNHVYSELNVVDAFHKALNTWAKWIDANVNPRKTSVFFRGYSASHFSGGQWNSGGSCDKETEPITNEQYLSSYPPTMSILEDVIHGMKNPVVYLNITRMTDYRKDAHPSVYRKQNLTEEERRSPERFQDCSHWCLPGVPDSWNELLYAQLLIKQHQMLHQ